MRNIFGQIKFWVRNVFYKLPLQGALRCLMFIAEASPQVEVTQSFRLNLIPKHLYILKGAQFSVFFNKSGSKQKSMILLYLKSARI